MTFLYDLKVEGEAYGLKPSSRQVSVRLDIIMDLVYYIGDISNSDKKPPSVTQEQMAVNSRHLGLNRLIGRAPFVITL